MQSERKKANVLYFSKFGSTEVHKVLQSEKKKLVDFSGSLKMKILALKDKNFHFLSPLKYIRFFKVREKKLMYFIFPNLGPLKYTRFCKVREKKLVYFSGSLNMKILALKVISDPLKYTSLIH